MNGAESLIRTLTQGGVEVCFANPGTSEMHFVAALDRVEGLRCILGLFEGVATGAADGYGRMSDKVACTLLHLGPGLANGLANLHNASRANTPIVNIVGDHASHHRRHDSPLTSDVEGTARPYSRWVRTAGGSMNVAADAAEAIAAARSTPGGVATLILPADAAWDEAEGPAPVPTPEAPLPVAADRVDGAARALRDGKRTLILLGGRALRERPLEVAGRIARATAATLGAPYESARIERGRGRVAVKRIPFQIDLALQELSQFEDVILVGSRAPVAFFAYPGKPSLLTPENCRLHVLATPDDDVLQGLDDLATALGTTRTASPGRTGPLPTNTSGQSLLDRIALTIASIVPENAIVVDESVSSGRGFFQLTEQAAPHDWLVNAGGSIGAGLPLAVGAAIACPDRKVLCLEGDGSAMYTIQALWTMARERLDVTTLVFANRSYTILKRELAQIGANDVGRKSLNLLELDDPVIDFVHLARGMGVRAARVDDLDQLTEALQGGLSERGPSLIELVL